MTTEQDNKTGGRPVTDEVKTGTPATTRPGESSVPEIGGPKGPEPTRYGDWERRGRCIDF